MHAQKTLTRVLIISFSDLKRDPRVYRQIVFLKDEYSVTAAGCGAPKIEGVKFIQIECAPETFISKVLGAFLLLCGQFNKYYFRKKNVRAALNLLEGVHFDIVIANDIACLPLSLKLARETGGKVLCDAHEYTPRQFEDRLFFRLFFKNYWNYICRNYLPLAGAVTTVSWNIAEEYKRNYGVDCKVITNTPFYERQNPIPVREDKIRIVYHGALTLSRKLETMIFLMDMLDERFTLDLVFVNNNPRYLKKLQRMSKASPRIYFREPVPMLDIPGFLNQYDIGLCLFKPNVFNINMSLPNKFFEFIQGRLCVAIWPLPEIARIIKEYDCGVVSGDFSLESIASKLNKMTAETIFYYKKKADRAAIYLNAEANQSAFVGLIKGLENKR